MIQNKSVGFKSAFLLIALMFSLNSLFAQTINIYVSPTGASTGNGSNMSAPVSLIQARVIAKANLNNPCIIWLMDGNYGINRIVLDATDSRTELAPVTYKPINPLKAIFKSYSTLNRTDFVALPDSVKSRIVDITAKNKVLQLNLTPYNLLNMNVWPNVFETGTVRWPTFYQDSTILPLSQYPNGADVMRINRVITNGSLRSQPGGSFIYRDDRGKFWSKAVNDGLWLKGNWRVPWQITYIKTQSINTIDSLIVQVEGSNNGIGDKYTRPAGNGKEPYVAVNLIEEIDKEGEWAINFTTKMLYMWPPATGQLSFASDYVNSTISLTSVKFTNIQGLVIKGGVADAVKISGCENVTISGMDISYCSGNAVNVIGGKNCVVKSNNLYELGQGGVIIAPTSSAVFNTDQLALTPCNHQVLNNHIYNFAKEVPVYSAAVNLKTVIGAYVANNKIHGTPHVGILYDGNNNLMEYNELYDIIQTYDDMGAFYRATGSKSRGNKIRYNYVHDSPLSKGTFYDNGTQGDSSSYNIDANNLYGLGNNGGYFNTYTNSIVINSNPATSINVTVDTDVSFKPYLDSLKSIYNASSIYRSAYPEIADMVGSGTINKAYTSRIWPRLTGNVFISNTAVFRSVLDANLFNANGTTNTIYAQTQLPFTSYRTVFSDNVKLSGVLINPVKPFLIDSLKKIGVFYKTLGKDWRINRIGLYTDDYRTSIASGETISGIAPSIFITATSNNNFAASSPISLNLKIKNPNISNCISQIKFFDRNVEIVGLSINRITTSFDSVAYSASWSNPAVGSHQITAVIYDAPNWKYTSSAIDFNVISSLPLQLISFSGLGKNCNTELKWTTQSEVRVNRFEIERSEDGLQFSMKDIILSKSNNSSNQCEYTFNTPQIGAAYYRLKMIDTDGKFSYSNIIYVPSSCNFKDVLELYPNPVENGLVNLKLYFDGHAQNADIVIVNMQGQQKILKQITLNNGNNSFSINTLDVVQGIYVIKVVTKQNVILASAKLVIR